MTATFTKAAESARGAPVVAILIVEDSAVQAELLRRTVETAGYAALVAKDGSEGLALARAQRPAAVISDVRMPEMDGYEMCRRMRLEQDLRDTPVIMLTELSEAADVIRGLNAGADRYVTKPYDERLLLSRLADLLANPPARAEAPLAMRASIDAVAYPVHASGQQVLNLLVSTYENAVLQNRELAAARQSLDAKIQELARSNSELAQFAYVASHDLQEPLLTVISYVQFLEERLAGTLDAETMQLMEIAVDGARHMQALIRDILAYSRVGNQGGPAARVDNAAALKEALDHLAARIAETGAQVEVQRLPVVIAERTQLVQLFQNLVGNAIKFCKDRAPRVRVDAVREAGRLRFSVTDNGIGIAPEYREQVFVVFKRLHARREYPGTGIGLALCKRIVERHGGEIGIESAPGGGSVVWFTLPGETNS